MSFGTSTWPSRPPGAVVVEEDVRSGCPCGARRPTARPAPAATSIGVTGIAQPAAHPPGPGVDLGHAALRARSPPRRRLRGRRCSRRRGRSAAACRGAPCWTAPMRASRSRVALVTQTSPPATAMPRGRKPIALDRLADPRRARRGVARRSGVGEAAARPASPPPSPRVARIAAVGRRERQREQRARDHGALPASAGDQAGGPRASASRPAARAASAPRRAPRRRAPPSAPARPRRPRRPRVPPGRGRPRTDGGRRASLAIARCTTRSSAAGRSGPQRRRQRRRRRRDAPRAWPRRSRGRTAPRRSA